VPKISVFKAIGELGKLIDIALIFDMKIINGDEKPYIKTTFIFTLLFDF